MGADERADRPAVPVATSNGITPEELQLAARNHGMPLEALAADITPVGPVSQPWINEAVGTAGEPPDEEP